jgi:hypothetical protein
VVKSPTYSEVGVDLTGLGLELPCIAGLVAESRSSPSTTATLKDFVSVPTGEDCVSSIDTTIHNAAHEDIEGTTVLAGTVVHDQATVSPTGGADNATGTVTFHRFGTIDCTGSSVDQVVTITDQIPLGIPTGTDGLIESADFTTVAGFLSYTAEYSGDGTYSGATMPADHLCEPLTIEVQPVIETDANPNVGHIGDTLQDTATLSGGSSPTGSITFELFAPGVDPCDAASTPVYTENVTVNGNGNYSTVTGFVATTSGTYEWTASYSGDLGTGGPNRPDDSTCPAVAEQVIIINPSMAAIKSAVPVATVTYSYTDQNTGDVDLHDLTLDDDKCDPVVGVLQADAVHNIGDVNDDGLVNSGPGGVGETWSFVCTTTITLPIDGTPVQNTVTATAKDTLEGVVTDTDSVTVTSTITVTKP